MANDDLKEKEGLLNSIRSINEGIRDIEQQHANIAATMVDDQTRMTAMKMKESQEASQAYASLKMMTSLDAVRAMMAQAIAEGTLETFEITDKLAKIEEESKLISKESLTYLEDQTVQLEEQVKQLNEKDIFGKSEADRLKIINDRTKENTSNLKDSLLTAAGISDEIFTMSGLMKAVTAGMAITAVESAKLARELGTGNGVLDTMKIGMTQISAQANALRYGFALSGSEARSVIKDITALNGSLDDATSMAITHAGELHVKYGIATAEAAKLQKAMKFVSDGTDEGARGMQEQVKALAKASGVAPGALMSEIADNTLEFARFGKDGAKGLVSAAANAKKLGISLSSVVNAGDRLLDVQGSIQAEMKAEMMIGKQLNLDALRQAALVGDRDTMIKEIAKNAGSLNEFTSMNVLQQKALADSLGVSTGEVLNILQAKEKGVNLDNKSLEAFKKQNAEAEGTTQALLGGAAAAGGLFATVSSALPALGHAKNLFGGLIPKGLGAKISGIFGGKTQSNITKQAAGLEETGNKLGKMKPGPKTNPIANFFKGFAKVKWSSIIKGVVGIALMGLALMAFVPPFAMLAEIPIQGIIAGLATILVLAMTVKILGKATGDIIKGAVAVGILGIALIPAAYAFSLLAGVNAGGMIAFGGAMIILGAAAAGMGYIFPLIMAGSLAMLVLGAAIIPAAMAMSSLSGVDSGSMLAFAAAIPLLGLGLAAMGLLMIPIALGTLVLWGLSKVLPNVTGAFANLAGVDGGSLLGFAQAILPLAIGIAALGAFLVVIPMGLLALMALSMGVPLAGAFFTAMPKVNGKNLSEFGKAVLPLAIGVGALGFFFATIPLGILALMMLGLGVPQAAKFFGAMPKIDGKNLLGFGLAILPLAAGVGALGFFFAVIPLGILALMALSMGVPLAAAFLTAMPKVDGKGLLAFGKAILPLAIGVGLLGAFAAVIPLGIIALVGLSLGVIAAAYLLANMPAIDPALLETFGGALMPLGKSIAGLGLMLPLLILGSIAAIMIGAAMVPFAYAFSLMQGVDPAAIDLLGQGIKSMIKIVGNLGLIEAGKLIIKAAAIAAIGLAIMPFGMAVAMASKGDPEGLVNALEKLAMLAPSLAGVGPALIGLGIGMLFLGIGFMAMLPVMPFVPMLAAGLVLMAPPLIMLAAIGPQMLALGLGFLLLGIGMIPFAMGMMMVAPFIPLMPLLAQSILLMTPPLVALAAVADVLPIMGIGFMLLGIGMVPFAMGMMMLAPFIPLMPLLAQSMLIMAPPLIALATIAEVLPIMGIGFMMLGIGLIPFAMGMAMLAPFIPLMPTLAASFVLMAPPLVAIAAIAGVMPLMGQGFLMIGIGLSVFAVALGMIFPFQTVLPILAKAIIDMAPPLMMMAPIGPQIMFLAMAIGALGVTSALATVPLFAFGAAAYFAAPAVALLGEASKVLGAGLEAVRTPLMAMATQFPLILALSGAITTLAASLLLATLPVFAFGAAAWFAMIPVIALAGGLTLMTATAGGLTSVGSGLSAIAAGLSEISQFKGTLALLAIAGPALALLGGVGMLGGGGEKEKEGSTAENNDRLIAKMDELILVINSKDYSPIIQMDGKTVGKAVAKKRGPKGA